MKIIKKGETFEELIAMVDRHLSHRKGDAVDRALDTCPLCQRPLDDTAEKHHLVPKSRGGMVTERLHKICHRMIHATFGEKELENEYNNVEALLENKEIQKFVKWVAKKPPGYYDVSRDSTRRKSLRKR